MNPVPFCMLNESIVTPLEPVNIEKKYDFIDLGYGLMVYHNVYFGESCNFLSLRELS